MASANLSTGLAQLATAALLVAAPPAMAQESDAAPEAAAADRSVLVGFRGIAETWEDPFIVEHYRSSRFGGAAMVHVPFAKWLGAEVELGFSRTPSVSQREGVAAGMLQYVPMAATLVAVKQMPSAELFGGMGYGMAVFTEQTAVGTVSGSKPGLDLRVGARIHTRMLRQHLTPDGDVGPKGMDVELLLGRRQHHAFGVGKGFDFSAWRLGAGMVVRL